MIENLQIKLFSWTSWMDCTAPIMLAVVANLFGRTEVDWTPFVVTIRIPPLIPYSAFTSTITFAATIKLAIIVITTPSPSTLGLEQI